MSARDDLVTRGFGALAGPGWHWETDDTVVIDKAQVAALVTDAVLAHPDLVLAALAEAGVLHIDHWHRDPQSWRYASTYRTTDAPTDDEFGLTLDPCEHPSVNGDECASCGEKIR